jgi:hypothetical protein
MLSAAVFEDGLFLEPWICLLTHRGCESSSLIYGHLYILLCTVEYNAICGLVKRKLTMPGPPQNLGID